MGVYKILLHKLKTILKIARGSEENAVLLCPENILKGFAMKLLCSCGNPQASLEFCGEVSCLFSWNSVQLSLMAVHFFWRQLQKRGGKLMYWLGSH